MSTFLINLLHFTTFSKIKKLLRYLKRLKQYVNDELKQSEFYLKIYYSLTQVFVANKHPDVLYTEFPQSKIFSKPFCKSNFLRSHKLQVTILADF